MSTRREGRCWRFGDEISSDQLINARHVFEYEPAVLARHLLEELRPEFAGGAQAGDLLVAGRRFAHGSNHSHPFIAMRHLGLGLICGSLGRGPFRLAVAMGVPLLTVGPEVLAGLQDAERLAVDFRGGVIVNETAGTRFEVEPLSPFLLEIVEAGGSLEYVRAMAPAASGD